MTNENLKKLSFRKLLTNTLLMLLLKILRYQIGLFGEKQKFCRRSSVEKISFRKKIDIKRVNKCEEGKG